ncbi:unnamed protein product [Bursaphelenchus okinawaensis]|uniref:Activin_recp domain-containing protein n=1 Tax=Bursaphelenchus okinawaensis TaxID=465554 RepID=A0A811KJ71_9BILA|nr:unnamed protein product [Bursaphelenchus okinawaensis]CAG9105699.1 unnamed protein product [Bursaphelenchus okinawaensis]
MVMSLDALKCKCTQGSSKTPCEDGICEVGTDGSCLALNHEVSGVHYACTISTMKDGECTEKRTKSNQKIKVCSCRGQDYCNYVRFPMSQEQRSIVDSEVDDDDTTSGSEAIVMSSSLLIGAFVLRWL